MRVAEGQSYLSRAVGFNPQIEIDYQSLQVSKGDVFLLATDGVYERVDAAFLVQTIEQATDLGTAASRIVQEALQRGSPDNLTVQIVVIDELPSADAVALSQQAVKFALPPILEARQLFDG